MSRSRDAHLLMMGALIAFLALGVGLAVALWFQSAVGAHSCVAGWRADTWAAQVEGSAGVWEPPPPFAGLPTCPPSAPAESRSEPPTAAAPPNVPDSPFLPAVEQWRPLVAQFWPNDRINDALLVISRESAGCATAAYGKPCPGVFVPRQNDWGCQARGLAQHCTKFWDYRTDVYGLPAECQPLEAIVDPVCNVTLMHAMWLDSGCSFWPHWAATDHGTSRGC